MIDVMCPDYNIETEQLSSLKYPEITQSENAEIPSTSALRRKDFSNFHSYVSKF